MLVTIARSGLTFQSLIVSTCIVFCLPAAKAGTVAGKHSVVYIPEWESHTLQSVPVLALLGVVWWHVAVVKSGTCRGHRVVSNPFQSPVPSHALVCSSDPLLLSRLLLRLQGLQGNAYSQNGAQTAQLLQQQQQQNALAALGPTQQAALLRKVRFFLAGCVLRLYYCFLRDTSALRYI